MESANDLPKPKLITGGCLCGALRYRVDFPHDHDFVQNTGTCQCTQCRRNSGSLALICLQIPKASFKWFSPSTASSGEELAPFDKPPSSLRSYSATPGIQRGFCATCGGFLFWMEDGGPVEISVGNIDPIFLVGPSDDPEVGQVDIDGNHIPSEGYGALLAGGYGTHYWPWNEIKGVTDDLAILGVGRGERIKPK
ncbi:hypothetical protein VMCG_04260 [Cytospora schulzeri]|uniref:CENP-V/GFA domain-containing protein n=1 Tax=Cytospora schulzeri TaxID=448051 RepID=A0A423WT63_9PEZI|nr:hypothetical protein VMCG_04260 [Valsa malicola]